MENSIKLVFMVVNNRLDDHYNLRAFSTMEKAQNYLESRALLTKYLDIEEFIIDDVTE